MNPPKRSKSRLTTACAFAVALSAALLPGCTLMRGSDRRAWSPDQAVLPRAEIQGNQVTVRNIRNCEYRTEKDYTVRYYDKTFNLDELDSVDFIVVPFPESPRLAHTMLSFGFGGRDYVAVSIEVRKRQGDSYSPITGAMGMFDLMYVVADEHDVIALRTNYRLNDVYVYRAKATPKQAQALFIDMLQRADHLAQTPEAYNTLTNNCTTNIWRHVNHIVQNPVPYDYRVLLNGLSDRMAYDLGLLETAGSFEETKQRARVTRQAYVYRDSPEFSQQIRR